MYKSKYPILTVSLSIIIIISLFVPMTVGINNIKNYNNQKSPISYSNTNISNSSWPMKCHDTHHTGRSTFSTEDNPPGIYKWRFECDTIAGGIVTGEDGTIYFGAFDAYLYAVNPNGTMKWRYRTGSWIWSSPAIGEDGTIYATSYDDFLYAVNSNGTLRWKFCAYDSISSSPIIGDDGTIYFGTGGTGHNIFAINPDGTEKWRYPTGYYVTSDPAIGDDGTLYIGSGDDYLYAMNANGTLKWRFLTGDHVKGPPSIADDGTIYVGSYDGYLYAINPDGTEKWRRSIDWGYETNPSIGADGTIYIGGEDLYATSPDGTALWDFQLGPDRWIGQSSAAISADGTIYFGVTIGDDEGAEIIAVNPDGTEKWRERIGNYDCFSSPCIGNDGTVYIGCNEDLFGDIGYLYAFGLDGFTSFANGPYLGIINEPVQFTGEAYMGVEPYFWYWDFGEGNFSLEQNPIYSYPVPGNYTVTLTVTDDEDNESVDTTWAIIIEVNNPPSKPMIYGKTQGTIAVPYEYSFIATDPEGYSVKYYIEWGDGQVEEWFGPFESGEEISAGHIWYGLGTFIIRAKAIDIFGVEGPWGELEVSMPRNKNMMSSLFLSFLKQFPILQKLYLSL